MLISTDIQKGKTESCEKTYFPICPFESTKSNGIHKAEVLPMLRGWCLERMPWSSSA